MASDLIVSEGVASTWFYHLSERTTPTVALCGARTFATLIPLKTWGLRSHLNERYCLACADASHGKPPDPIDTAVDAQLTQVGDQVKHFAHQIAKGLPGEGDA